MSQETYFKAHVLPDAVVLEFCVDGDRMVIELPTEEAYAIASLIDGAAEKAESFEEEFITRFEAAKAVQSSKCIPH